MACDQQAARAASHTSSACGAVPTPPHTLESCFVCARLFHTSCCSPLVQHPDAHPTPRHGYDDWVCADCVMTHNLSGGLVTSPATQGAPPRRGQQPSAPGGIPTMSVADDPRPCWPARHPRRCLPHPPEPAIPSTLHTPSDAQRMQDVPVMRRATRHTRGTLPLSGGTSTSRHDTASTIQRTVERGAPPSRSGSPPT